MPKAKSQPDREGLRMICELYLTDAQSQVTTSTLSCASAFILYLTDAQSQVTTLRIFPRKQTGLYLTDAQSQVTTTG